MLSRFIQVIKYIRILFLGAGEVAEQFRTLVAFGFNSWIQLLAPTNMVAHNHLLTPVPGDPPSGLHRNLACVWYT